MYLVPRVVLCIPWDKAIIAIFRPGNQMLRKQRHLPRVTQVLEHWAKIQTPITILHLATIIQLPAIKGLLAMTKLIRWLQQKPGVFGSGVLLRPKHPPAHWWPMSRITDPATKHCAFHLAASWAEIRTQVFLSCHLDPILSLYLQYKQWATIFNLIEQYLKKVSQWYNLSVRTKHQFSRTRWEELLTNFSWVS